MAFIAHLFALVREGRERKWSFPPATSLPPPHTLCLATIPSEWRVHLIKIMERKSKWIGPQATLRVCVHLQCLPDSKQVWKLNVKNQWRPRAHHRRENRALTAQLMPVITVIKAPKWLHSTLSLTALAATPHSCYLQWPLSCSRKQLPLRVLPHRVARWGGFAPLFAPVKGKRQQKDSLGSSPSPQSFSDLLGHKLLYGCNET